MSRLLNEITREQFLEEIVGSRARSSIADHFPNYCRSYHITRLIFRYELFKMVIGVHGAIIDCGVGNGSSLLTWLKLSNALEPHNHSRGIIGFDTFTGFPSIHAKDGDHKVGDMAMGGNAAHLRACISMVEAEEPMFTRDDNGPVFNPRLERKNAYSRAAIIDGDFLETGAMVVGKLPQLVVALLSLDFDIYEPTKRAIELFVPRMPKGAVIVFDELNHAQWPGETLAVAETLGLGSLRLQRFPWEPSASFAVLE
jgi:hypothetical protein